MQHWTKTSPFIILIFLLVCFNVQGQTFSIDTASFLNEDNNSQSKSSVINPQVNSAKVQNGPSAIKQVNSETESPGIEYNSEDYIDEPDIPEDAISGEMLFVPSMVLYNSKWDTLNIRMGRTDWSKISDSALLIYNDISESKFVFPYKGKLISKYGRRDGRIHAGMDIKLNRGDTVVSAFDGKVRIARSISGYGKLIVVRHDNGLETVYGHLSKFLVKVNDFVKAGEPIGLGGRTGRASTDHLHFETRILGEHFDPSKIIDFESYCLKSDCLVMDKDNLGFGTKATSIVSAGAGTETSAYVKIKPGDTLYALARKHKTSVDKICRMNGISPKKVLRIGTRLRIE
ncbi:MAG TPA: M23 family metallopeptidase [Lentimicrobium sp.]|nr:M23 family metallopeptidase [Lentimicrobium sp.]